MENANFKRALGDLITRLRKERHISQEHLALEAEIDRTRIGEIERGEANVTIDTLNKIASTLNQTLGSLIGEAEEIAGGVVKKPIPTTKPECINRSVPLPKGLTHDQLEKGLNKALVVLSQIGLDPTDGDIQFNIYSGVVSNVVTKAIAETSDLVQNKDTKHPDLYNTDLPAGDADWGLEVKATNQIGKGAESHNPGKGWFMVVIYQIVEGQTYIVQVEAAQLEENDWVVHERAEESKRTRTAVTLLHATNKLRRNSVYLEPDYLTPALRKIIFGSQLPEPVQE